jgi:hypothetical protein
VEGAILGTAHGNCIVDGAVEATKGVEHDVNVSSTTALNQCFAFTHKGVSGDGKVGMSIV